MRWIHVRGDSVLTHATRVRQIRVNREHQMVMSRRRAPCLDVYLDKVSLLLWPRFKAVLDAHIASVRNAPVVVESLQAQPLTKRYADLAVLLHSMRSSGSADGQLEHSIVRSCHACHPFAGLLMLCVFCLAGKIAHHLF